MKMMDHDIFILNDILFDQVLSENRRRLQSGLLKLRETNELVAQLQEKLKEFQPKVIQKASDAEMMLKRVAVDQQVADKTRVEVWYFEEGGVMPK